MMLGSFMYWLGIIISFLNNIPMKGFVDKDKDKTRDQTIF